jgi:hypothetical protein
MVKSALKTLLISALILSNLSCATDVTSSYSRKNIEQIIKDLCQREFDIDVNAWLVGETLWVYVPFGKITDEAGKPTASFTENTRQIFLTLRRAFLNMDNPPQFYCFVLSDTEDQGFDFYRIGFVRDFIKFQMGLISLDQINQRVVILSAENEQALGDREGKHITAHGISIGDFIGYLVQQQLNNIFIVYPNQVEIREIQSYYQQGKLGVIFDIKIKEGGREIPEPFSKTKEIIKKYLEIYNRPESIVEIEIIDDSSGKRSIVTQAALFD